MNYLITIEKLRMNVSATYGSVLKFGNYVLVTDANCKGRFTADIYKFTETPEETGLAAIECILSHICHAEEIFADNGHAIAWCIGQVTKYV